MVGAGTAPREVLITSKVGARLRRVRPLSLRHSYALGRGKASPCTPPQEGAAKPRPYLTPGSRSPVSAHPLSPIPYPLVSPNPYSLHPLPGFHRFLQKFIRVHLNAKTLEAERTTVAGSAGVRDEGFDIVRASTEGLD